MPGGTRSPCGCGEEEKIFVSLINESDLAEMNHDADDDDGDDNDNNNDDAWFQKSIYSANADRNIFYSSRRQFRRHV
jgi:hypothetical protein